MYKLITGRTHYYAPAAHIAMVVTISGDPTEELIENATQKAIQKHEMFSKQIILDNNGDSYFSAIEPKNRKLEVRELQHEEYWKELVREQERIPFDFNHGEVIRFFLLKNATSNKLVIISNHLVGDGMSIIYLIRDIMTALADPNITYEEQPVILMDDFGYPENSRLNFMHRLAIKQVNKLWKKDKKVFEYQDYLTMFHSYWKDRSLGILDGSLDKEELKALVYKCREHHITVNSAIAAVFLTSSKVEKEVGMAVNVRPEGHEGMGNYASGISVEFEPRSEKSFWKNAVILHKLIHRRLSKDREKYFVLEFLRGLEPTLVDATYYHVFAGFHSRAAARVADWFGYINNQQIAIGISNLAKPKIPSQYGNYSIEKIDFVPPLLPNNKLVIGVVTIEDKMNITMQYERKKGSEKTEQVFKEAISMLKQELE